MKLDHTFKATLLGASLFAATMANAAPITLNLSGSVIDATGVWAGNLNSAFSASLTFDLDSANAYSSVIDTSEAPAIPAVLITTYTGSPYGASFAGNFGTMTTSTVFVETIDNLDADAIGNPYGLTGTFDVLSIFGSGIVVDCSAGTVDPVTGCDNPDAPWLYGEEFGVNLIWNSDWFSGNILPTSIPALENLVGIYGHGDNWSDGTEDGTIDIEFNAASSSISAVPVPAAVWLFGSGLIGLIGIAKRKKA